MTSLLILFLGALIILIKYYQNFYQYWDRRNVPNLQALFAKSKHHLGIKYKHVYQFMKKNGLKHGGVYIGFSSVYVISDLSYVKNVMTKDFKFFPHRGLYYNEERDPLSAHIFNLSGTKWRNLRTKLNTIFTSHKLKRILPILLQCQQNLHQKLQMEYQKREPIDMKQLCDLFISDVIESCIFGSDCKRFNVNMNSFVQKIFSRSRSRRLKGFIVDNFPNFGKFLNITLISKESSHSFSELVTEMILYRRKNKNVRHDFLEILTEIRHENGLSLTIEEIAAQCFIFFLAGMSTSPTAVAFTLYELARNADIQERLRNEINTVLEKYEGKITIGSLQEMKYLDQTFKEALRKYPPAAYLNRKCEEDYKIPNSDVVIQKGTIVVIPVLGIHYDEEFFPDPDNFDPDRFSEENEKKFSYEFIPFGEGPRICLGMRFGILQSKIGLISLLKDFKFTINKKTQEPLKMKPKPLVLTAEGGIWLNIHKIDNSETHTN